MMTSLIAQSIPNWPDGRIQGCYASCPPVLEHLLVHQQQALLSLVAGFSELFGDIPIQATMITHDNDGKNTWPVKQHVYHINSAKCALLKQEAEYLLKHGFPRLTVPDTYTLPRMDDCPK